MKYRTILFSLLCSIPVSAFAQDVSPPPPPPPAGDVPPDPAAASAQAGQPVEPTAEAVDAEFAAEEAEIVVTGSRPRGSVIGDIPPEIVLSPRDIRAYGASNVAELIDALAPQTGSGRGRGGGRPVVLVNGRRISSFSEVRDVPPEAIVRVDILPEEVALRYGYRADQRVVNLVLRRRFQAVTAEVEGGIATAGGRGVAEADINYLRIQGASRTSVDAEYENRAALLESERDIIQAAGSSGIDQGDFRTLLPGSETLTLGGTHNRMVFGDVAGTFDARFTASRTDSLLGLPANDLASIVPLGREAETWNGHFGLALDGTIAPWRWNFTANLDRVETDTATDRLAGVPADTAEQINQSADARLVANGPVVDLWAGPLTASLTAAGELRSFDSQSRRGGTFREASLSRQRLEGQASFDLPITSRREGVLGAIGDLSVNLNLNAEELSDFGTLTTIGYGLNWRPISEVTLIASVTEEEGAPGIQQLGEPAIATPNVRVFDFVRGETVDITRIDGGNPALVADSRRVLNLGANVRPIEGLSIRANYTDSRIDNPIASFPAATAEIEAAFPDRFVRGPDGRLVSIDTRPINFASSERRELRYGFDFSAPFGPQGPTPEQRRQLREQRRAARQAQREGDAPPPEGTPPAGTEAPAAGQERARRGGRGGRGGFGGGGFGGGRFGGGGGGGRLQLGIFHTWRLEDTVTIREGGPVLDFLGGSAAGNSGGTPEHRVELRAGIFRNGFGARLNVDWQSGTRVEGGRDGDLFFSDLTTINLRLFANLGQQRALVRAVPFLRGTRVSLVVDNLLDSRVDVRDGAGTTPLSYQPFYLDPLGRSVRISLRKQFF